MKPLTQTLVAFVLAGCAMAVIAAIVCTRHPTKTPPYPGVATFNRTVDDATRLPRVGQIGAPMIAGQCGQLDPGGGAHRIECPKVQP
jgi:hypothetical protein